MTCTTFLHDSELNQKTPYSDVNKLLQSVREITKQDWQIVPINITTKKWYKTTHETFLGLYVYVGGIDPWQQINFFSRRSHSSINLYVTIEEIASFLKGIENGYYLSKRN